MPCASFFLRSVDSARSIFDKESQLAAYVFVCGTTYRNRVRHINALNLFWNFCVCYWYGASLENLSNIFYCCDSNLNDLIIG